MISRVFIFCIVVIVGCQSKNVSNLPTIKASREEAVVIGKLLDINQDVPKGNSCGSVNCFGKIQIEEVKETGQDFTKNFEQEKPVIAYFTYGLDGADSNTHQGLQIVLEKLKQNDKIIATLRQVGDIDSNKLYQVDLYKKLKK